MAGILYLYVLQTRAGGGLKRQSEQGKIVKKTTQRATMKTFRTRYWFRLRANIW